MIYRIWDTLAKKYRWDIVVDGFGNFFLHLDNNKYVRLYEVGLYVIERGFNIDKKCFYENDVIEYGNSMYKVSFEQTQFRVYPQGMFKMHSGSAIAYGKVVGNTNENPELLK